MLSIACIYIYSNFLVHSLLIVLSLLVVSGQLCVLNCQWGKRVKDGVLFLAPFRAVILAVSVSTVLQATAIIERPVAC